MTKKKTTKNTKLPPITQEARQQELRLQEQFKSTSSEAKETGIDIAQTFDRVKDIETLPGWGVRIILQPTPEDPTTERNLSYWRAYELAKTMSRMLKKIPLADAKATAEMFTKFERKLLEAVEKDPT